MHIDCVVIAESFNDILISTHLLKMSLMVQFGAHCWKICFQNLILCTLLNISRAIWNLCIQSHLSREMTTSYPPCTIQYSLPPWWRIPPYSPFPAPISPATWRWILTFSLGLMNMTCQVSPYWNIWSDNLMLTDADSCMHSLTPSSSPASGQLPTSPKQSKLLQHISLLHVTLHMHWLASTNVQPHSPGVG